MQEYYSKLLSISVIVLLALVPVMQALPLNLPPLLPSASATGGITLNSVSSNSSKLTASPFQITLASFNAGTGSNRLLVVGVEANNQSVSSITFGGVALTQAAGSFHNDYTAFWSLKNPNGTAKIVVTMGGSTGVVIGAYALSGVDQTNPIPTTATYYRSSGNPTISLNTLYANSVVLDSPAIWGGVTLGSPTCTKQWNATVVTNQISGASSNKTQATPGTVTCGWTASGTGNGWDDSAIEVKASGAASATTPIVLNSKSTAAGNGVSSPFKITVSKFNPGTSSNRLLVVGISASSKSATSVKFGTTSLTQAISSFHNNDAEFWYLKNPSSTPADLVVTMSGNTPFVVGTYSFSGVDQAIPIATTNATNNTSSSSPRITITTSYANSTVLDLPSIYGGATLGSPTCTQQWDVNLPSGITGASSNKTQTTPGKVTCAWTASSGELWDDVAVEIKASTSKWTSSAGIMEPLYIYPYAGGNPCNNPSCFAWTSVVQAKNTYPNVQFFAIANPSSGPGTSIDTNYQGAIANLTKNGVIVLGYISTQYDNGHVLYKTARDNINKWSNWYGPGSSTMGGLGIKGIFLDEMSNNATSGNMTYYGNLTSYIHGNFTYSVGNPGTETSPDFIGKVDRMVIYENLNSTGATYALDKLNNSTLQGYNFTKTSLTLNYWHTQYDKSNFGYIEHNQSSITQRVVQGTTPYVGFLFITNATCACYDHIPSYLSNEVSYLNNPSVLATIRAQDNSGSAVSIPVTIYQSNNQISQQNTPFTYNSTSGWQLKFTGSHICKWSGSASNSSNILYVTPTASGSYTAEYNISC